MQLINLIKKVKNTYEIKLPNGKSILRTWRFSKEEMEQKKIPLFFNKDNVPRIKIYENEYKILKPFSNILLSFKNQS